MPHLPHAATAIPDPAGYLAPPQATAPESPSSTDHLFVHPTPHTPPINKVYILH